MVPPPINFAGAKMTAFAIFATAAELQAATPDPLQFIMTDPAFCLCPGLFRHLTRADVDVPIELRIAYEHGDTRLRVRGPLLGGFDLAILQAVEMVAATSKAVVTPSAGIHAELIAGLGSADSLDDEQVDEPLVFHGVGADDELLYASCSISHLLTTVGLPLNSHYTKLAAESLERLSAVTIFMSPKDAPSRFQTLRLLSRCKVGANKRSSVVHFALHPRLTAALLNRGGRQDTRLCAEELQALAVEHEARVLHQRLCALINDGTMRPLTVASLVEYLFPEDVSGKALAKVHGRDAKALYDVKQRKLEVVAKALGVLCSKLNWTVKARGSRALAFETTVEITRPSKDWTHSKLRAAARQREEQLALAA